MIRIAVIAGGFLTVTITLILLQKDSQPHPVALERVSVPSAKADAPVTTAENIPPAPDNNVSRDRAGLAYLDSPEHRPQAVSPETPPPVVTAAASDIVMHPDSDLETLIAEAMAQGQSPAYIAALVQSGGRTGGKVAAPQLVQDGKLNTASLIGALSGNPARGTGTAEPVTYAVQAGDTLAAIAYRFYGDTAQSTQIVQANSDILGGEAALAIGQRLVIPTL
ncbi:LysM peptidoglycan-binding domain-containing protein [Roseovarius pacificus]|uniref:LysM peptidoglycan-binding domain-containing protein n=1 Tax=Roseovarius pacificus TaxID=337701 RepID=UPI0040394D5F